MATRCTSVDQFVATFHRFCGDDQTFFVATVTSRPVGLETAFSIQLADKQPVLRGLCVVLDAWATADNRFKRPGIRLGIKRLTSDSQIVFDRLRAASRAPDALAALEATPPPSPLPALPPLPRLSSAKPPLPSIPRVPKLAAVPEPIPEPIGEPIAEATPPDAVGDLTPPPIEVTRFQVALNVGTIPPPLSDVEFKPTQLMRRPRVTPGIANGTSEEPAIDAAPAVIVDKPPERPPPPAPRHEERTPGSSFILPANPLHDLSDESLEGFVDCTLYEDAGAAGEGDTWHDELVDLPPTVARPASSTTVPAMPFDRPPDLAVRTTGDSESLRIAPEPRTASAFAAPVISEPMPAEPEPEPDDQAAVSGELPEASRRSMPMPAQVSKLSIDPALASEIAAVPAPRLTPPPPPPPVFVPAPAPPPPVFVPPPAAPPPVFAPPPTSSFDLHASTGAYPAYPPPPQPAPAVYAPYPASMPIALPTPPPSRELPAWQRALLIAGTVAVAIVLAFVIALRVRGPLRSAPPVSAPAAVSPHHVQPRFAIDGPDAPHGPEPRGSAAVVADPIADDDPGAPVVGSGPCRFTLATTPAGSLIHFDDQPIGASPLTIDGSCDKHKIDIAHARYQPTTRWVTLAAGQPQQLEINLLRPIHAVTVTSDPPGADVLIEGHRAGTTPTVVQMTGFATVHLTFTKPGFHSVTKRVYSKLAQDRVTVQLKP